ncbi:MAG: metal-sensitive transcriptional regulator [Actinobacteria bacterium]|nr:metal-sensitive transcriptional regulator [Actinomycetota bacterium]
MRPGRSRPDRTCSGRLDRHAESERDVASYIDDKPKLLARLRRIEGQVRGLQRMIDEEKYCVDVLTQISSVIAALQGVGLIVLEDHVQGCVKDAITRGENADEAVAELIEILQRFVKTGPVARHDVEPA